MKKIIVTLVIAAILCATLAGCAPGLPNKEEAKAIAETTLKSVCDIYVASKYECNKYSDGTPMEYEANGINYYLINNFESLFNSNNINADQTIKLKKDLGLLITEKNGVFISKDTYAALSSSKFTGNIQVNVDSASRGTIKCTVTCSYSDNTTKDFPCELKRYYRTETSADNKTDKIYYWSIISFFNPTV